MAKRLLLAIGFTFLSFQAFSAHYYIYNVQETYVPDYLQVNLGDTVTFATTTFHTTQQVTQATWLANDTTLMPGGLDGPPGGFTFVATTLGDIYYVCVEHVQMDQMKGIIKVSQLDVEENKLISMHIMQSVSEQYVKLTVTGGVPGLLHVEMLNLSGQVVKTAKMNLSGSETSAIIQVGDMPKGVYMIRWSYGTINKARKIILQ
jgi:plastocyanin